VIRPVAWCVPMLAWAATARACPLCESETGDRVRAGLFDGDFGFHLMATLLPFPVLLAIVAVAYFGLPWRTRTADHG